MMYTVASVFLLFSVGFPQLKTFPKRCRYLGSLLFVAYEFCLSLSIGNANNAQQAIEVGMVNYLWPTFTLIAAIILLCWTATRSRR
ncbi:Aromatic amino acid exporter YddG [Pandoraea eparura]|uniref:Aromatic amino acid exporter YddG n=1 Tax=Pandoraea eparura TaxID=2508291 RepID=A0A5E4SWK3_9BURK|nr:Aromatic amino acid exporter YddG [Pandoraea eparura]